MSGWIRTTSVALLSADESEWPEKTELREVLEVVSRKLEPITLISIKVLSYPENIKLKVLKEYRALEQCSLAEGNAKIMEFPISFGDNLPIFTAHEIYKKLDEMGAVVEMKLS